MQLPALSRCASSDRLPQQAWGAGVGLGQASELRDFASTTLRVLLLAALLDWLWVRPNAAWLETQLDFASVQAAVLRRRTGVTRSRFITYLRHMKSVK